MLARRKRGKNRSLLLVISLLSLLCLFQVVRIVGDTHTVLSEVNPSLCMVFWLAKGNMYEMIAMMVNNCWKLKLELLFSPGFECFRVFIDVGRLK